MDVLLGLLPQLNSTAEISTQIPATTLCIPDDYRRSPAVTRYVLRLSGVRVPMSTGTIRLVMTGADGAESFLGSHALFGSSRGPLTVNVFVRVDAAASRDLTAQDCVRIRLLFEQPGTGERAVEINAASITVIRAY